MSTLFITGVTGFIGSSLASVMAARGHRVIGSTRSESALGTGTPGVERKLLIKLGDDLAPEAARDVDVVVHCAWDLRPGASRANVDGTERLVNAFQRAGVAHQVFISTYSAHSAAVTEYGIGKFTVQRWMLERGHTVARLGVTIGPGGIYRRMSKALVDHAVVPLIDGGRHRVPIVGIADLCDALATIIERRLAGTFNLFNDEFVPLRDVLVETRAAANGSALLVSVPSWLLVPPLQLARMMGIALPLDVDNVRAMLANRRRRDRSDLSAFVEHPMTLTAMVTRAAQKGT